MSRTEAEYFEWLCSQFEIDRVQRDYTQLFHILFSKEFQWTVPNDDNRLTDACELRHEFFGPGDFLRNKGATVLEVIVALSRRLEFNASEKSAGVWAWQLIKNLHLHRCWDPLSLRKQAQVHDVLDRLIWRQYNHDGEGGFFPLRHPEQDQTKREIWYQMHAYIQEQFPT